MIPIIPWRSPCASRGPPERRRSGPLVFFSTFATRGWRRRPNTRAHASGHGTRGDQAPDANKLHNVACMAIVSQAGGQEGIVGARARARVRAERPIGHACRPRQPVRVRAPLSRYKWFGHRSPEPLPFIPLRSRPTTRPPVVRQHAQTGLQTAMSTVPDWLRYQCLMQIIGPVRYNLRSGAAATVQEWRVAMPLT